MPRPRTGFYEGLLEEHGDSSKSLDWSLVGQMKRFQVLREVGIREHHSVLDLGCGLAHFYSYLCSRLNIPYVRNYVGIDSSEKMIEVARKRIPDLHLHHGELFCERAFEKEHRADFVVASGLFNIEDGMNESETETLLKSAFDCANIACAVNMLSDRAPSQREDRHYYSATEMLGKAFRVTKNVSLRHDYLPNDFTLYLYH